MLLRKLWPLVRRFVPVALYPQLAVFARWESRQTVRRLQREDAAFLRTHPSTVAPPAQLRFKVVGPCTIADFLDAGRLSVDCLEAGLHAAGSSFSRLNSVLDWGCGCGRTALALRERYPPLALTGADIDAEAIAWCAANLPGAHFDASPGLPPLPYAEGQFDLVTAISVFTHLDETRQDQWLAELRRVLRPGGILLATVHGPTAWGGLPPATVERIRREGVVFARTAADHGLHPDWYQTTWHSEDYVRRHWTQTFDLAGYLPDGMIFDLGRGRRIIHDLVVLQKK